MQVKRNIIITLHNNYFVMTLCASVVQETLGTCHRVFAVGRAFCSDILLPATTTHGIMRPAGVRIIIDYCNFESTNQIAKHYVSMFHRHMWHTNQD